MTCFLFGHAPSGSTMKLAEQIHNPAFECRRCGSMVRWSDMPRRVRERRDLVLKLVREPEA